MVQPVIRAITNFTIKVEWVPPVIPNGEINYYEVKTQFIKGDQLDKETVMKSKHKSCVLHSTCQNVTGYYTFAVRAINFVASPHNTKNVNPNDTYADMKQTQRCDENDTDLLVVLAQDPYAQNLHSNWSSPAMHSCQYGYTKSSEYFLFSILLMVMSFVIAAVVFMFYKIKNMKDILVQMPPGLEDLTSDTKKGNTSLEHNINKPDILSEIKEEVSLLKGSSHSSLGTSENSHISGSTDNRSDFDDYDYDGVGQVIHKHLFNNDRHSRNSQFKVRFF